MTEMTETKSPMWNRLVAEPPFRILYRALLKRLPVSIETRALWELSPRPAYLLGVWNAARLARQQRVERIAAIEFGVAGGAGLVALEREAAAVERATGVEIRVFGFDSGEGLPSFIGDYRDHPDLWQPGDFRMDPDALRSRLSARTTLILGDVADTAAGFVERYDPPPIGFAAFDLDLYSATKAALGVFRGGARRMLRQVPLYFDDIDFIHNHRFAGELLAIDEFNATSEVVKIDRWHGVSVDRPFPERSFLTKLYVAHDLEAISRSRLARENVALPLARE